MGDSNADVRTARGVSAEPAADGSPRDSFDCLPALIFRRQPESPHPFAWIGGGCAEIAGLSSRALSGDVAAWWERVPSGDRERALAAMERERARGSSYRVVYAYTSPAGARRTLREEACALVDAAGRVLGFEGVIVDISEERASLEKLREREKNFRALTENSPIFVVEIAADAQVLYASPRFTDLLGYAPEDLVGTDVEDLVHPDDRKLVEAERIDHFTNMTTTALLTRVRHRDGSWRCVEVDARPYRTASGVVRDEKAGRRASGAQLPFRISARSV